MATNIICFNILLLLSTWIAIAEVKAESFSVIDDEDKRKVVEYLCTETCDLRDSSAAAERPSCPITKPPQVLADPSNVCVDDVNLCPNQNITFTGRRCPATGRITISFYVTPEPRTNPEFDARFGFGNRYRYQATNRGVKGWGKEQIFAKKMELKADQDFVMEFIILSETSIEWRIDGSTIGTYKLRENGKVSDITKVCVTRCVTISTVELSAVESP